METNYNISENQNFFISEEEKNSLIETSQNFIKQKNQCYMNMEINEDNSQNLMSNQNISDSENLESDENESDSNLLNFKDINKEIIFDFYQAVKDNNISFIEEFVKTESNIKCKFSNNLISK